MATAPHPLVAGNWKMNGLSTSEAELAKIIAASAIVDTSTYGALKEMYCAAVPPSRLPEKMDTATSAS